MKNSIRSYFLLLCTLLVGSVDAAESPCRLILLPVRTNTNLVARVDSKEPGLSVERVAGLLRSPLLDGLTRIKGVTVSEGSERVANGAKTGAFGVELTLDHWSEREVRQVFAGGTTGCRWSVELKATLRVRREGSGESMETLSLSSEAFDSTVARSEAALPNGLGEELLQRVIAELSAKAVQATENLFFPMAILSVQGTAVSVNRSDRSGLKVGDVLVVQGVSKPVRDGGGREFRVQSASVGEVRVTSLTPDGVGGVILQERTPGAVTAGALLALKAAK